MTGRTGRSWRVLAGLGGLAVATGVVACSGDGGAAGTNTAPPSTGPIGTASSTTSISGTTPAVPTTAPSASTTTAATGPGPASVPSTVPPARPFVPPGTVVVVDPGHNGANGANPGAINRLVDAGGFQKACNTTGTAEGGLSESAFVWDLAQRVRTRLESAGVRVVLTRQDDDGWGPCIDERGQAATRVGADALVSLHADGADAGAHGFHVIHPTVIPGYTDTTAAPSAGLAADLRDVLVEDGFTPSTYAGTDGLIARGDLGTLNRAEVPAAMVEVGNMHNARDFATMTSATGTDRLADALAAGVVRYLAEPVGSVPGG